MQLSDNVVHARQVRMDGRRAPTVIVLRIIVLVVAVGLWELVVDIGAIPPGVLAAPSTIVLAAPQVFASPEFLSALAATVRTWAVGLAIALVVGIPVGLLIGSVPTAYRLSRLTLDFLRTIPPVALIPLALLLYGASDQMALLLIVFGCIWPIVLQTMYGAQQVDPQIQEVGRAFRFRRSQRIGRVLLPSALPMIATGIRISATLALLLAIGAELIGSAPGLGAQIFLKAQGLRTSEMYVYILVCAVLGAALNLALLALERRVLTWIPAHR